MQLFEYALIYHPKKTKKDDVEAPPPKLLLDGIQRVLAKDEKTAAMVASRAIPEEYADKLDQVQVAIRPF